MPEGSDAILEGITAGLVTHCRFGHKDHLDRAGARFLAEQGVPVYCGVLDERYLRRRGLEIVPMKPKRSIEALGGRITAFPTRHGSGLVGWCMGPGLGYLLELPGEPSVYLSGDTILTPTVRRVLSEHRPEVAVVAAGGARMDVGKPILMPVEEVVEFARLAPGAVVANHLEALNHCPVSRDQVRRAFAAADLGDRTHIPKDGESLTF